MNTFNVAKFYKESIDHRQKMIASLKDNPNRALDVQILEDQVASLKTPLIFTLDDGSTIAQENVDVEMGREHGAWVRRDKDGKFDSFTNFHFTELMFLDEGWKSNK